MAVHSRSMGLSQGPVEGGGVGAWGKRGSKGIFFFPPKISTRMMWASRSGGQSKRLRTVNTVMWMMTVPVLTFLWCPDGNARMPYVSLREGHAVEIAFSSFTALC